MPLMRASAVAERRRGQAEGMLAHVLSTRTKGLSAIASLAGVFIHSTWLAVEGRWIAELKCSTADPFDGDPLNHGAMRLRPSVA